MSIAGFAIPSELPPVSVLPQVPLRLPGKAMAGNVDRATAELNISRARLGLLRDLSRSVSRLPINDALDQVTIGVRKVMRSDFALVALLSDHSGPAVVAAFDSAFAAPNQEAIAAFAQQLGEHVVFSSKPWAGAFDKAVQSETAWPLKSVNWISVLPLTSRDELVGILALGKRDESCYTAEEVGFLLQVASQVALAVQNTIIYDRLGQGKANGYEENKSWKEGDGRKQVLEGIVGKSVALQRALRELEVVAPTDSGVLILGETGTGKELIAQAIHNLSARRDRPFVKVNCAAIPSGLLESELFGHEKGAFTGAIMRKPGRFELADKGTLFLDEVGDIPLELQPKLLRVLQEHEFERLGSTRTQQVDVRVVAATHRDLKQMVADGEFRSDLYYRLHVFPLPVPPLRKRCEDIPLLVCHFVDEYARRMNRRIETIPPQAMEALTSYSWPGNVRELQNFIERAVILSPGTSLRAPLGELTQETVHGAQTHLSTLEEMEREHVLRALKESNWVTGGPKGAAAKLGMKRTTLAYRIRKLNIPLRPQ